MSDLLWPGDHRATGLLDDAAFLDACLRVEAAWSAALAEGSLAPAEAMVDADRLQSLVAPLRSSWVRRTGGVVGLVLVGGGPTGGP